MNNFPVLVCAPFHELLFLSLAPSPSQPICIPLIKELPALQMPPTALCGVWRSLSDADPKCPGLGQVDEPSPVWSPSSCWGQTPDPKPGSSTAASPKTRGKRWISFGDTPEVSQVSPLSCRDWQTALLLTGFLLTKEGPKAPFFPPKRPLRVVATAPWCQCALGDWDLG